MRRLAVNLLYKMINIIYRGNFNSPGHCNISHGSPQFETAVFQRMHNIHLHGPPRVSSAKEDVKGEIEIFEIFIY